MKNKIINKDVFEGLSLIDDGSIDCCITSPPYYNLRKYGDDDRELGNHETVEEYVNVFCNVFDGVHRVLKEDGVFFLNIGDSYLGGGKGVWKNNKKQAKESFKYDNKPKEKLGGWKKPKQLALIPFRVGIEMQNRGWILRNNIVWEKPNAIPQSVNDRFITNYETIFMFVKSEKYYFNKQYEDCTSTDKLNATKKRGMRSVWRINTSRNTTVHTATFPEELVERMIISGCPKDGIVLDPFIGSGTTAVVAKRLGRNYIGIELNQEYIEICNRNLLKEN